MGDKTIGNDLDNAEISFSKAQRWPAVRRSRGDRVATGLGDQVWLPKDALLDKYAGIQGGEYATSLDSDSNMTRSAGSTDPTGPTCHCSAVSQIGTLVNMRLDDEN